ncbi:thioredoxin domain-containing protein 5-like [Gigantopelta aegis]|uniref:thioredoxin domain-containing protein 5-like n=1 Tax=Gigantopelta aegis TaxID=1735272 RepID=UPI001B88DDDD|nr:thioredoxin domain-containing protein 5-like [Gigantopelta aegis]
MATNIVYVCGCFILLNFRGIPADSEHGEATVTYKSNNFMTEIAKNKHFVMFYAPWCGHCKRLTPTWNELAKIYNKNLKDTPVIIAKVDCTTDTVVCAEHDITGYPTLKFFDDDASSVRYKGNRDLETLQKYVEKQLTSEEEEGENVPPSEPWNSLVELDEATFEKHIKLGQHFIKFYAPWCGHCKKLAPVWEELAKTLDYNDKVTVAKVDCTVSKTVCSIHHIQGYPTLLWFKNGQVLERYTGPRTLEALKTFSLNMLDKEDPEVLRTDEMIDVNVAEQEGAVPSLTEENFEETLSGGYVFVKFFAPWCGHCKRLAPTWEDLSKKFSTFQDVIIAEVDCTKYGNLCQRNEVKGYPTLVLFYNGAKLAEHNGPRGLDDMYSFVMNQIEGAHDEL